MNKKYFRLQCGVQSTALENSLSVNIVIIIVIIVIVVIIVTIVIIVIIVIIIVIIVIIIITLINPMQVPLTHKALARSQQATSPPGLPAKVQILRYDQYHHY